MLSWIKNEWEMVIGCLFLTGLALMVGPIIVDMIVYDCTEFHLDEKIGMGAFCAIQITGYVLALPLIVKCIDEAVRQFKEAC